MKKIILCLALALAVSSVASARNRTVIKPLEGEYWWGAVLSEGSKQPFTDFSVAKPVGKVACTDAK